MQEEGRKEMEEGRKENNRKRKERRKEGREEGRKEGRKGGHRKLLSPKGFLNGISRTMISITLNYV